MSCLVRNLPPPSSPGLVEFSYKWPNNTVLITSKDLVLTAMDSSTFFIEINLPNVANRIFDTSQLALQIINKNFPSLIFSFNMEIVPSPALITFVDPTSGPNNRETEVVVYVEYFQGSLSAVEALLNGVPMSRDSISVEAFDVSISAFYFKLPRAISEGRHVVSFRSGDNNPLSFHFTALDALTPRLKYMFPSQGSIKGGDVIYIMVENFDSRGKFAVLVGAASADVQTLDCQQASCRISAYFARLRCTSIIEYYTFFRSFKVHTSSTVSNDSPRSPS